jgi:hypothetical protein
MFPIKLQIFVYLSIYYGTVCELQDHCTTERVTIYYIGPHPSHPNAIKYHDQSLQLMIKGEQEIGSYYMAIANNDDCV